MLRTIDSFVLIHHTHFEGPSGAVRLTTEEECNAAAESEGKSTPVSTVNSYTYPGGCFQYSDGTIYFNSEPTGPAHGQAHVVCCAGCTSSPTASPTPFSQETCMAKITDWQPRPCNSSTDGRLAFEPACQMYLDTACQGSIPGSKARQSYSISHAFSLSGGIPTDFQGNACLENGEGSTCIVTADMSTFTPCYEGGASPHAAQVT